MEHLDGRYMPQFKMTLTSFADEPGWVLTEVVAVHTCVTTQAVVKRAKIAGVEVRRFGNRQHVRIADVERIIEASRDKGKRRER